MGIFTLPFTDYDLAATLDCGQCFNFDLTEDGTWQGVAKGRFLTLKQIGDRIEYEGCPEDEFPEVFVHYFAMDEDYTGIKELLSQDPVLRDAIGDCPGIRIMNQDLWEATLCFIISQNNNIPRIKGIIRRLRENWGSDTGSGYKLFPTPEELCDLSEEDLSVLRCGYRSPYILDCADRFHRGAVDEDIIRNGGLNEARDELRKIKGIGPKVADCTLLFGAHRLDAFPVDVWMKRCINTLYPGGLPEFIKPYAGIAQQYLFHYSRTSGIFS